MGKPDPSTNQHYVPVVKPRASKRKRNEAYFAFLLILPAVTILALVIFIPLFQALRLSFTQANLLSTSTAKYIGFQNFVQLFHDGTFWTACLNTIEFVVVCGVGGLLIGMALALCLNANIPFQNFFRGIALLPWVIPGVVIAILGLYVFNTQAGIVDWLLVKLGLAHQFIDWFGSTHYALWAEMLSTIWQETPFYMLMILAALQTVPQEQYEAATIDGASKLQSFLHVTLPNIRGVIMIVTSLMVIWNFNTFDVIWTTTRGGPVNSTTTLSIYVYRKAFKSMDVGYAAAMGLVWLVFLLLFSTFYIRALRGRDEA